MLKKTQVKLLATAAVLCGSLAFNAAAQINIDGGTINIRTVDNPYRYTYHYGDLWLEGGIGDAVWGWLKCNRIYIPSNNNNTNSYINTDLTIQGNFNVSGSKNFIHPHPTDTDKVIRYVATESGEALTLAQGSAKTVNGEVTIKLPEHFSLVTSKEVPVRVIVTPKGAPVLLYTKEENKGQIVVAMKKSDFTEFRDVEFAYQVTGVRDGFVGQEVIIAAEKLDVSGTELNNDVQKRIKAYGQRTEKRIEKQLEGKRATVKE